MSTKVDLRELAVRRNDGAAKVQIRRSRHLISNVLLPGLVIVGFVAVLGWAARDLLLPARPVTVQSVVTTHQDVQTEGTPLFQAAGWVEPRPTPIFVTALSEGVIDKLFVVEGQAINAGDPIAQLIQDDARLALRIAEADRDMRMAELQQSQAALATARALLPSELEAARSRLELARQTYEARVQILEKGATPLLSVPMAKSELASAAVTVAQLEIRAGTFKNGTILPFAEAEANVRSAAAKLKQAESGVATARLRLDRTIINAPMNGKILALHAKPGQRLMGQMVLGAPEASTIVAMYDPAMLQVRADVRLEDVPKVLPGQKVAIDVPVAPDHPLEGEVLQITSQADIQKNTLQVKVAVKSPPATLRPDMLVQVSFLAAPARDGADAEKQSLRVLIAKQLVESAEGHAFVWTADLAGKVARKKPVTLGRPSGDFIEVLQGLNPADRLIVDGRAGLSDGQRITISQADSGISSAREAGGIRPKRLMDETPNKNQTDKR